MKILLVNDDGYYAEGIQRLKKELDKFAEVFVCAPKDKMSAKSCSVSFEKEVKAEKIDEHNYVVDGTPADCANYGCTKLNQKFDLVVSGCNKGLNCSMCIMWSGTIGACLQAQLFGYPCVAFSTVTDHFDFIEKYTQQVMKFIFDNKLLNKDVILNVNYPYDINNVKGIKISEVDLNDRNIEIDITSGTLLNKNPNGVCDYEFNNKNGDLYHLSHGYISVAPLSCSYGNKIVYEETKNKVSKEFKF